jgi:hypothetical protein
MNKLKAIKEIFKLQNHINRNPEIKAKINNFEKDIRPKLCKECYRKFPLVEHNLMTAVSQGRFFCSKCNDLIAKESTELFVEASKE